MLVQHKFEQGEVTFDITQPFRVNDEGQLEPTNQWVVRIEPGTVTALSAGPMIDQTTKLIGLYDSEAVALQAALTYAHSAGLRDA